MRSVCWRRLRHVDLVEAAVADDLVGRLLRDQPEAALHDGQRALDVEVLCVRFSSDHTWRIASVLKMPWKMLESMMVDGHGCLL